METTIGKGLHFKNTDGKVATLSLALTEQQWKEWRAKVSECGREALKSEVLALIGLAEETFTDYRALKS